jgi:hypothetical protein
MVKRGITAVYPTEKVTDAQKNTISQLLSAVGKVVWLDSEDQIDLVTGVSGSGPAYVFYMTETLKEAGKAAGLPEELAEQLAIATVCGAGELMHQSGEGPAILRQNVTSPNGTTAAALDVLMSEQWNPAHHDRGGRCGCETGKGTGGLKPQRVRRDTPFRRIAGLLSSGIGNRRPEHGNRQDKAEDPQRFSGVA